MSLTPAFIFCFFSFLLFYRIHILSRSQNSKYGQGWKQPNQESCFSKCLLPPGLNPSEKCHTFKGTAASKLNYSHAGLPWRDQTSAGIHRFLTVCLSHRMDLLNHTSSSTEERTSFPLPWSICTRMDLEQPPSNKTLHQQPQNLWNGAWTSLGRDPEATQDIVSYLKPSVSCGRASCPCPHHQPHRESS